MRFVRTAGLTMFAVLAAIAGPAMAHPKLLSSSPAANATVAPVKEISMTFSEGLVAPVSGADLSMDMTGMDPMKVAVKTSVKDGKTFVTTLDKPLTAGHYTLSWHVVSTDTHRVEGKLAFTVK